LLGLVFKLPAVAKNEVGGFNGATVIYKVRRRQIHPPPMRVALLVFAALDWNALSS
jgi:hypothetical protein